MVRIFLLIKRKLQLPLENISTGVGLSRRLIRRTKEVCPIGRPQPSRKRMYINYGDDIVFRVDVVATANQESVYIGCGT